MNESAPASGAMTEKESESSLDIRSDVALEALDVERLRSYSADLAEICGDEEPRTELRIVTRERWPKAMADEGRSGKEFTGSAMETPIPAEGMPRAVLPGPDVFTTDTVYGDAFRKSETLRRLIDERPADVYRAIYLSNIAAHEISHLYQFTDSQRTHFSSLSREKTLKDETTGERYSEFDREYGKDIPLREFTAVLYGFDRMVSAGIDPDIERGFLEANAAAQALPGYTGEQARRTLKAAEVVAAGLDRPMMKKLFAACRDSGELHDTVSGAIESLMQGTLSAEEFIDTLRESP